MADLVIKGGYAVTPLSERLTNIWVKGNKIHALDEKHEGQGDFETLDATGMYVTPGLFDLQVNGDHDCNLWADPSDKELDKLKNNLAQHGVTSFLPTLITDDVGHLKKNIQFLSKAGVGPDQINRPASKGSSMLGVHLEGPFLSPAKPGVHPPQFLKPLSVDGISEVVNGSVALVTLAPELEPDGKVIEFLRRKGIAVSLGHSNANFEEAQTAFARGVGLMTHTFNALPPLKHRDPGAVGAAMLDENVTCCVIADGLHVDAPVVKLLIRIKGPDKVILVSDAAHVGTAGGGLVGSSITLDQAVQNVVKWGAATFGQAILMAAYNPAKAMGYEHVIGELAAGRIADIVLWDKESLQVKHVIKSGQKLF